MTGLYVDTSAVLKRVFIEDGSTQVREILGTRYARGDLVVSSELTWVELSRALLRAQVSDVGTHISDACAGIARQPLNPTVMKRAREIGPSGLRSLDAIHLAAAIDLGATEMLTFDHRLAEAATLVGVNAVP